MSAKTYSRILSSPRLRRALLPEGLRCSPYEVLRYEATLTLHDARGMWATFQRRQEVRFLQSGVSAILDHVWGAGVPLAHYHNDAGELEDWIKDDGRKHLVIGLPRAMLQGERLSFEVNRTAMAMFSEARGWVETNVDHPVARLSREVVFPRERPCRRARLNYPGFTVDLPITVQPGGGTSVAFEVGGPSAHTPYTITWDW